MYFNSLVFALFISLFFGLYWFVFKRSTQQQNVLIVLASYLFYGWWDWRFLTLIFFSSLLDYYLGHRIYNAPKHQKKRFLYLSLAANLGFLAFFKYYNFFITDFVAHFDFLGFNADSLTLRIILPVGISFYTFQTLSYSIDIYRNELKPTNDPIAFFAFVSFFPQLVAGPIERAQHLLPQFSVPRRFDYSMAVDGLRQFLWGLFKKVVIADNAAALANPIFENYTTFSGSQLAGAIFFFSFQIYADFSGYSDMAIGLSKVFGFRLKQNFNRPYFSRNIGEFWRRWHISLSTWFRDYVYIPLGGSHASTARTVRNLSLVFLVSALWHGANMTFICWGLLHTLYFLPGYFFQTNRKYASSNNNQRFAWESVFTLPLTFLLVSFAWIFFRSETVNDAFLFIKQLFISPFTTATPLSVEWKVTFALIGLMLLIELFQRQRTHALEGLVNRPLFFRWTAYISLAFLIYLVKGGNQTFIYFQF